MNKLCATIIALALTVCAQTTILEWDGTDIPDGWGTDRKAYDEFHTVAPDRECLAQSNWYGNTARVPLDIITYASPTNHFTHYFDTDPSATIYCDPPDALSSDVMTDPRFMFYIGQAATAGFPNPQLRSNADGYAPDRIWVSSYPLEGSSDGNCYAMTEGSFDGYSWWTVMSWPKRLFQNGGDAAPSVKFNANSTLMIKTARDYYWGSYRDQNTNIHFMIRNGAQYYLSEHHFRDNHDGETLTDFNDNDAQGKRWHPWNPTPTDFRHPDPMPAPVAVDFDNVTEVGVFFFVEMPTGQDNTIVQLQGMKYTAELSSDPVMVHHPPAAASPARLTHPSCGSYSILGRLSPSRTQAPRGVYLASTARGMARRLHVR